MSEASNGACNVPPLAQYEKLFHKMTGMAMRRALAAGIPLEAEDVQQELAMSYLRCRDQYKPDGGANFMTFLIAAAWRNLERSIFAHYTRRKAAGVKVYNDDLTADGGSVWDITPGSDAMPDEVLEGQDLMRWLLGRLSADAKAIVTILLSDDDLLHEQLAAFNRGVAEVRAQEQAAGPGVRSRGYTQVNFSYVVQLLGLGPRRASVARREIETAISHYYTGKVGKR